MRTAIRWLIAIFCLAPLSASSDLDGKWSAELQTHGKKSKKSANAKAAGPGALNLLAGSGKVSGAVGAGKRALTIQDGKLDGSDFSFVTLRKSKKGEARLIWSGKLDGDQLHGARTREGGKRGSSFAAKRL